jgi:hypothetical protein
LRRRIWTSRRCYCHHDVSGSRDFCGIWSDEPDHATAWQLGVQGQLFQGPQYRSPDVCRALWLGSPCRMIPVLAQKSIGCRNWLTTPPTESGHGFRRSSWAVRDSVIAAASRSAGVGPRKGAAGARHARLLGICLPGGFTGDACSTPANPRRQHPLVRSDWLSPPNTPGSDGPTQAVLVGLG